MHKAAEKQQEKLKELGDVQNWAEVLERDIRVLEEAVAMGEGETLGWEGEDEGFESGGEEEGRGVEEEETDDGVGHGVVGGAGRGQEQKALGGKHEDEGRETADKAATGTENR